MSTEKSTIVLLAVAIGAACAAFSAEQAPGGQSFKLKSNKTGTVYGPFTVADKATIKLADDTYTILLATGSSYSGTITFADGKRKRFTDFCGLESEGPSMGPDYKFHRQPGHLFLGAAKPERIVEVSLDKVAEVTFGRPVRPFTPVQVLMKFRDGSKQTLDGGVTHFEVLLAGGQLWERHYVQLYSDTCPFHGATISFEH